MTLQEYLHQKDPVRRPHVVLERSEVSIGRFIGAPCHRYASVFIQGINHEYAVREGSNLLYTTDEDGNPRWPSVFYFKENIYEVSKDSE